MIKLNSEKIKRITKTIKEKLNDPELPGHSKKRDKNITEKKETPRIKAMFENLDIETIENITERLKVELEDPELPKQRKEEVNSLLYYADTWIKEKARKKR